MYCNIAEEPKFEADHLLELRKLADELPHYRNNVRPFVQKFLNDELKYSDMTDNQKRYLWAIYAELDDITGD